MKNIIIQNKDLKAELSAWGATLVRLITKDKNGNDTDVCLGYDSIDGYKNGNAFFGATIGRVANRIGNARFSLNDEEFTLIPNENKNVLHGGKNGYDQRLWQVSASAESAVFSLVSPDGDQGFPGEMKIEVTYALKENALEITYRATCDKDTPISLTNHSYFNLGGHVGSTVYDHTLTLFASAHTPTDSELIPTGEIRDVTGTALDLRGDKMLYDVINDPELSKTRGLDHNFVLDKSAEYAAILYCEKTGIEMKCKTTLDGIQVYTAGNLTKQTGKNGIVYDRHGAVCLETQHFPNAVNTPSFPSAILKKGNVWEHKTSYIFSIK